MTREQRERAELEMKYLKQRMEELAKLFELDRKQPPDPTEPHKTLQ